MTDIATLMDRLVAAGLWLARKEDGSGWQIGPKAFMDQLPELVAEARAHKAALIAHIESHPATALFTLPDDPAHAETADCGACGKPVYVLAGAHGTGKRLGAHRLADGRTVCPDSLTPLEAPVRMRPLCREPFEVMEQFIAERCEPRPHALLTWHGFKGALMGWCMRGEHRMPADDEIKAYMLAHYPLPPGVKKGQGEVFGGLVLKPSEWLGEE